MVTTHTDTKGHNPMDSNAIVSLETQLIDHIVHEYPPKDTIGMGEEKNRYIRSWKLLDNSIREKLKDAIKNKRINEKNNIVVDVDSIYQKYLVFDALSKEIDKLKSEKNELHRGQHSPIISEESKKLKTIINSKEESLSSLGDALYRELSYLPNIPDSIVPIGATESDNQEVFKWGQIPKFDYKPKDHIQLAKDLDLIDFERGSKVGGFRAYFLKNEGAQLEFAVLMYAFQKLINKGYTPVIAPSLVRKFTLFGNGQFPWGEDEVYKLEKDSYLAGTAEVPITAYFSGEMLVEKELPKRFVAFSPCFRKEAGSYRKDMRGAYRLHQFNKIEQVIISTAETSTSLTLHEELLANSKEILEDLGLPYRVLLMCTGDMGEPQVKKYDIETWMPCREAYGETMSNSFMGDFQSRRLNIRYKGKDGKSTYTHTLNNTAIATPRILIAIFENYQQADGSIRIPDVLQPFVGKKEIRR